MSRSDRSTIYPCGCGLLYKEIHSDNSTNFMGTERELREALEQLDQAKIYNSLRLNDVQWSFNPPEASHQGRIWECMICSVQKILGALLKEQLVNDETLSTLLCEVERILKDRPLTSLSDHPVDHELLTLSKLQLLRSNSCLPPVSSKVTTSIANAGAKHNAWQIHFGRDG